MNNSAIYIEFYVQFLGQDVAYFLFSTSDCNEKIAAVVAVSDLKILSPRDTDIDEGKDVILSISSLENPPSGPIITAHFLYLSIFFDRAS